MKLNKSEAIAVARKMANENEAARAVTVEQLEKMDWSARKSAARGLAVESMVHHIDTRENYLDDAVLAFEEQIMDGWSSKTRALENKRKAFKNACRGLSAQQATAKMVEFLRSLNIRGGRVESGRLEIVRGRCNATLYFRLDRDYDGEGVRNPDDESQRAGTYEFLLEYSTSGTTYTPAEMAVVAKIHAELLDAGNELTAMMQRERIIWTWGIPEATTEEV